MRFVSLFSGSGGFDLGLERAGHECVLQVELDDYRAGILRRHWPDVPLVRDVRDVRAGEPLQPGSVDLVCGGFPCRDLSTAGRRRGIEAEESEDGSGLFFECARVADELLRPGGWLLIENVPGMLSTNGGRDFAVLIRTLGELGFHDLAWRVLDSRYFGVPQRRQRVFIVARRADGQRARDVLLEPEGGGGDHQADERARAVLADRGRPGAEGDALVSELIAEGELASALTARFGTSGTCATDAEANWLVPEEGEELFTYTHGARESGPHYDEVPTLRAAQAKDMSGPLVFDPEDVGMMESGQGDRSMPPQVSIDEARTMHTRVDQQLVWHPEDETGMFSTGQFNGGVEMPVTRGEARTLTTRVDQQIVWQHDEVVETPAVREGGVRVRRLTPTECERLQGFPDGWTRLDGPSLRGEPSWYDRDPAEMRVFRGEPQPWRPRWEAMGRAVTVPVAEWLGWRLAMTE